MRAKQVFSRVGRAVSGNLARRLRWGWSALVIGGVVAVAGAPATPPRPNILLIVADDLGFSDLGAYGGEIRTPHLDRLAREGLRYTQFYNNAVCVTTRVSLLTGLYPRQGPNWGGESGLLKRNMATLGDMLRTAGYETVLTGKWHLGAEWPQRPIDRGFGEFYGVLSGGCNYFNPAQPDPPFYGGQSRPFAHNDQAITTFPEGYYATDAFSEHVVQMIRRSAASAEPFFINLNYTAPHFPLHALPEDIARYRGKYAEGYEELRRRRYARLTSLGLLDPAVTPLSERDPKSGSYRYDYPIAAWRELEPAVRQREEARMEVYAAMVDRMDQGIGRVLAALEETGQADRTLVIFLSDNGGCASLPLPEQVEQYEADNRGIPVGDGRGYELLGAGWGWAVNAPFRRFKTWTYEGGVATPMIVRWPGVIAPGTVTDAVGHVIDFMPTFAELAGVGTSERSRGPLAPWLEGESLVPSMKGPAKPRERPLFWEMYGNRAVRDGRWKLVWGASERRWQLYDLATDRSETRDLAAVHPERVEALATAWSEWAERTGNVQSREPGS